MSKIMTENLISNQDRDFEVLKCQILKDQGFDCNQYRDTYIKRRLAIRLRANNLYSCRDYAKLLNSDPMEYNELMASVFDYFRKNVIPSLILDKRRKKQKIIRIWSAGCASGEETYSIAILMYDFLGATPENFIISVHGTDIDGASLAKAKKG
jgi:chemotaxis methyl-accepting protein methylase